MKQVCAWEQFSSGSTEHWDTRTVYTLLTSQAVVSKLKEGERSFHEKKLTWNESVEEETLCSAVFRDIISLF